ncbi:hypothetical protein H4P12_08770 [Paracoccus sp. 11-3]|uniref:Uncharacterized protein n=1 Tax=Paracoccus amoyensis TaxID=2760093 RepID=A0A926JCV9_9RHOB|nr:hypothetical protein [Paracoccus amoyensis]MBC9246804.1 hypothetical protein [Paracoccus amoyensis]
MSSVVPIIRPLRRDPRKTPISFADSARRNRILTPQQCLDTRAKLQNIRNLASAADREYRTLLNELDKLDREGRAWLVVDLIHKTSLASLDLAADFLGVLNQKNGEVARKLADGTQTISDGITVADAVIRERGVSSDTVRTVLDRLLTHSKAESVGAAYGKGKADTILSLWNGYENTTSAQGHGERSSRSIEATVDTIASVVQANADAIDASEKAGNPVAKRISAAAGISRSMASYRREVEGAFNRRLEIRNGLQHSRAQLEASLRPHMDRFHKDAAALMKLLEGCQP